MRKVVGSNPHRVKPKTFQLVTKHTVRAKTGRNSILGKMARIPVDCCFRELARLKSDSASGLEQSNV